MNSMKRTELGRSALESGLKSLIKDVGKIKIGNSKQFPYGWGKAAKGRTVWRILEELVTQNLKKNAREYGFESVREADSEVGVYDFECKLAGSNSPIFVNVKSAVEGGRQNKDDISKAKGLMDFYESHPEADLFIATMCIAFYDDMSIELVDVFVVPLAWLPDIYVNPSNNGNLQSNKYKDFASATRRSNVDFVAVLGEAIEVAREKRVASAAKKKK